MKVIRYLNIGVGVIKGSIHPGVLDEVQADWLLEGTVLVLKQVSVFSPSPRRHYLNITARNLVTLFLPDASEVSNCVEICF